MILKVQNKHISANHIVEISDIYELFQGVEKPFYFRFTIYTTNYDATTIFSIDAKYECTVQKTDRVISECKVREHPNILVMEQRAHEYLAEQYRKTPEYSLQRERIENFRSYLINLWRQATDLEVVIDVPPLE